MRTTLGVTSAVILWIVFVAGAGAHTEIASCGATTHSATSITATSAQLNGVLGDTDLSGDSGNCGSYMFDYGTSIPYGFSTPADEAPLTGTNVAVSSTVFGLTPDTTYHYRIDAANGDHNLGDDLTFHTAVGAALQVTDSVDHPVVLPGANVTFTIVVTNHGPASATSVNLTDSPPEGLAYTTITPTAGSCFQSGSVICSLGTIVNGGSVTVTIVASTSLSTHGMFTDAPDVTATNSPGHTTGSATVTVESATVALTDSASPSTVTAGSTSTFTVNVANSGPDAADGVSVSDSLPAGLSFISVTPSSGSCSSSSPVICSFASIASGGHASVAIVVGTSATGTFADNASVTGPGLAAGSQTSASAGITVQAPPPSPPPPPPIPAVAALTISNTPSATSVTAGANVTYGIVVANHGPANATGVTVTDTLPSGLTFVSASTPGGSCSGTTAITCTLGTILNGTAASVTVVATAPVSGAYDSTASASASNLDPTSHPSATASITVSPPSGPPPPTSPATGPNVVVNDSIDGVSIGDTEQSVEKQLGKPDSTLGLGLAGGNKGKLARYKVKGGLFIVTYDQHGDVVSLEVYSTSFRTSAGLGPGSSLTLVAGLKGFHLDYCELGYWNGTARTGPNAVVTVFTPNGGIVASVLITRLGLYTDCATGSRESTPVATLKLDRSVGGVTIGMGERAVTAALGAPKSTLGVTLGAGMSGKSVTYTVHGAPLLITYDATGKVVSIESYSPFFKTVNGIGPGAPLNLVRALRGFRPDYCELGYWNGTPRTRPSTVVTVFTPNGDSVASVLITQLRLYTACSTGSTELPPTT